jgi:hypothetical protein
MGIFGLFSIGPQFDFYKNNSFTSTPAQIDIHPLYPTTDYESVRAVVGAAHTQFDKVKELVNARPELAKATWDWGFGDVESALGAASHMGRKDIAEFLIEKGARPDIYTFAMLGKINTVKSMIEDMPGIQKIRGPHGFTLLHHARMRLMRKNVEGAELKQQEALVDYLTSLGDADISAKSIEITEADKMIYVGKYPFGEGSDEYFEVKLNSRKNLSMARGDTFGRALLNIDKHTFAPGGAPSVRIQFEVNDGVAQSVTIHDPMPIIKVNREQ